MGLVDSGAFHPFDAPDACSGQASHLSLFTFHFSRHLSLREILLIMELFRRSLTSTLLFLSTVNLAIAQASDPGGSVHGKILFQQNCAVCHADTLGEGNSAITRQGPSLVGVFGNGPVPVRTLTIRNPLRSRG
jgi:mono/diheme cytochrome c family protein